MAWYFALLLGVYCVGIAAIVRSNRFYIDDIGRALYGYAGWFTSARPVAEAFSYLFYLGGTTFDASPLTQVLGLAFLAGAALCVCLALRVPLSLGAMAAVVPIGLNPYGLENISYKFDSAQMCLAVFLAVLPYLFFHRRKKVFWAVSIVCVFCSASIYQPTVSAYLAVGCYMLMLRVVSRNRCMELARMFWHLAAPFVIAILVCAAQTPLWLNRTKSPYIHEVSSMPSLKGLFVNLAHNCRQYVDILRTDWRCNPLGWLMAALFCCFVVLLLARWWRGRRHTGAAALPRLALLCALLPCFLLTPLGVLSVLPHPIWHPRAFSGFGFLPALMLLALHGAAVRQKRLRVPVCILQACFCLQLVIFAQVYGNLLTAQGHWERTRIAFMVQGLTRFIRETGVKTVYFKNSVGMTPLAAVPARNYPLLEKLVVVHLVQGWEWGHEQLKLYGVWLRYPEKDLDPAAPLSTYADTPVYRLEQTKDGAAVVSFKAF